MAKLFLAFLLSLLLMTCGWYFARIAKSEVQNPAHVFQDEVDNSCNDDISLNFGSSYADDNQLECIKEETELANDILGNSPGNNYKFLTIQKGESLGSILKPHGISATEIAALSNAFYPYVRPKEISEGDLYDFKVSLDAEASTKLEYFIFRKIDQNSIPFLYTAKPKLTNNKNLEFSVSVDSPKISIEENIVTLKVKKTLFQTFINIPYGNELMQRLISILTWRLQMPQEVLDGDEIEIFVEHKYADGQFVGYGKIKDISYRQNNRHILARYFASEDKMIEGYFDNLGRSIEKEFLVSPVHETTATSNQKWRLHPVRKMHIRHNGIDFRGSIGTEFFSLAAGEVVEKRFDVNVGNMIRIKHNHGVYTEYFHANSLVDKLKVGSRVKRGQKLGEIGRTGKLCTGPHLHLGIYTYNSGRKKFITINSLKNKLANQPNISARHLPEFNAYSTRLGLLISQRKLDLTQNSGKKALATQ